MHKPKTKVKILQITSGLSTEGIGTFVLNTYENLNKESIDVSFALATEWKQRYEERILNQGAKIYRTSEIGKGFGGKFRHFTNLIRIIKKEGPFDVVHSHMDFFNGINMLAAFIAGVPIRISHAHKAENNNYKSLPKKIYNKIMKISINLFATHKIGCSQMANDYMHKMKGIRKENLVLFNGIDLNRFTVNNKKKLEKIEINTSKKNFITIGRMDDQKNPLFIVEIIKELKIIRNDIHLYWVGSGSLEKQVKDLVSKYDLKENISFLGVRDDVHELLSQMDFMLFPSKFEGLPIVLLEAQASGIPCFVSNNITSEVNIGLCTQLSLDENQAMWARKIDHYINTHKYNNKLDRVKLKKFDIKNTCKELEMIYLNNDYFENKQRKVSQYQ